MFTFMRNTFAFNIRIWFNFFHLYFLFGRFKIFPGNSYGGVAQPQYTISDIGSPFNLRSA